MCSEEESFSFDRVNTNSSFMINSYRNPTNICVGLLAPGIQ